MNTQAIFDKQHYVQQMHYICHCIQAGLQYDLHEIIADNFAGGGGASTGIEIAVGRSVEIAINHDIDAIRMHMANHPSTKHYCESVWDVNPLEACNGKPVGLAWFSPDCKHFSKAKGGKPKDKSICGLAWVALRWAGLVRPRVIMLENVEEFQEWGPLNRNHRPIRKKKGKTFHRFIYQLEKLGYQVEFKELMAADYGAPTKRKRFFMIARCDGQPIVWPEPTHGPRDNAKVISGELKSYVPAADIIDWSIHCTSIFERKKPLAENTMRRIARGLQKFVTNNPDPFIVQVNHSGEGFRGQEVKEPMPTLTAKHGFGLVTPYITQIGQTGFTNDRNKPLTEPITTVVSKNEHCLIAPTLIQYHSETTEDGVRAGGVKEPIATLDTSNRYGLVSAFISKFYSTNTGDKVDNPLPTITATGQHNALCAAHIIQMQGQSTGTDLKEPLNTITAGGMGHMGEVVAFLIKYYGSGTGQDIDEPLDTVTSKDRFGLVKIQGVNYQIIDIGLRMLEPHELYAAQGFPEDYIIDRDIKGKKITKTEQVKRCGNSVCPPIPAALVKANLIELCTGRRMPICRLDRMQQETSGQLRFA